MHEIDILDILRNISKYLYVKYLLIKAVSLIGTHEPRVEFRGNLMRHRGRESVNESLILFTSVCLDCHLP
jgi:hypothetical protein